MANCILLIFEGAVSERVVWQSLKRFYLCDDHAPVVYGIYGGEIYSLYHKMKSDPDLDLFSVLKQAENNKDLLEDVSKDDVSEIYLFFDYDGHAPAAADEKLSSMLNFFNEETENGKLFLSYPMVEALRHLDSNTPFHEVNSECKTNIKYKNIVHNNSAHEYRDVSTYTDTKWKKVISAHCMKLNFLMENKFEFPKNYFDQISIFNKQLEKHIKPSSKVAVLSAFPVFLLDYYGCAQFSKMITD